MNGRVAGVCRGIASTEQRHTQRHNLKAIPLAWCWDVKRAAQSYITTGELNNPHKNGTTAQPESIICGAAKRYNLHYTTRRVNSSLLLYSRRVRHNVRLYDMPAHFFGGVSSQRNNGLDN